MRKTNFNTVMQFWQICDLFECHLNKSSGWYCINPLEESHAFRNNNQTLSNHFEFCAIHLCKTYYKIFPLSKSLWNLCQLIQPRATNGAMYCRIYNAYLNTFMFSSLKRMQYITEMSQLLHLNKYCYPRCCLSCFRVVVN